MNEINYQGYIPTVRRPKKWFLLFVAVLADDSPQGLISTDNNQDLVAEATQNGAQNQKRDAGLSNSYGEPIPADSYGPPLNIPNLVAELPIPVYGVPETNVFVETPPGAYGPPAPVVFPDQNYEGPPPPVGKPKPIYGPPKFHAPKQTYGPPKPIYGPPKKTYGPPKQGPPKISYGPPFKPPKISFPKPSYGVPKPVYGAPKPVYGPPKLGFAPPPLSVQNIPVPNLPISPPQNLGIVGASIGNIGSFNTIETNFGSLEANVGTSLGANFDLGLNLPAPIYGTPITSLPGNLKPKFPIPSDTYGPPGLPLGPVGPNDQIVVHDLGSIGHYGPPQPDPNPRPPHPGIPAPPTPPHVLYDGWKPIPGVSKPFQSVENVHFEINNNAGQSHIETLDQYGPPPPIVQEVQINLDGHSLPSLNQQSQFSGAQISSGYSNVHQDALSNIDLNAIVGGDSNHIDQSKTVFEAHYTENNNADLALIQGSIPGKFDSYSAPPLESLSNGPYPPSLRQQGAKGLIPPSGIYGVPPGNQYGAPPKPLPANLPIPYGSFSGGGHSIHTGGHTPRHPIKFRESVPEGLIQQISHVTHHKDAHNIDHVKQGPAYLPPPIKDVKEINQHSSQALNGVSLSIEPSNLYSLPHSGAPLTFQVQHQPSNLYGSPIDSYSVPLLTVSDHVTSDSSDNAVAATIDGKVLANLSNLEAAAILKHCPYHEAILKAAKLGEKIPAELASSYVASLSSLGSAFHNHHALMSTQNGFNIPIPSSESVSYNNKDLSTASHTLVQTVLPNQIENEKTVKGSVQKGKSIRDQKDSQKQNSLQYVSDQIYHTSEKIKNLSEETKQLQQKIVSNSQNFNQVSSQYSQFASEIPGKDQTYSVQIQSSDDGKGKSNSPSIPHEQLLSEGLLQSILQAIEQPSQNPPKNIQNYNELKTNTYSNNQNQQSLNYQASGSGYDNLDEGGLVLPVGYEPVDRTKTQKDQEFQGTQDIKHVLQREAIRHDHDCDLRADNSITHTIVVPPPSLENVEPVEEVEINDVAIYFGNDSKEDSSEKQDPVTEISVATSVSENFEYKKPEYGEKIKKDT
ncbi:unnamed protein product [Danaus chrysippus]|uniref:(African queen) hypothetical protein n=1 Tax=Danaus chrysippus TaxID=151541 RepID=A0A8J2W355_9NEOP|nr:unnamed protein product [Danaus chrysippus]